MLPPISIPHHTAPPPQGEPILQVIWWKRAEVFNNPGNSSGVGNGANAIPRAGRNATVVEMMLVCVTHTHTFTHLLAALEADAGRSMLR